MTLGSPRQAESFEDATHTNLPHHQVKNKVEKEKKTIGRPDLTQQKPTIFVSGAAPESDPIRARSLATRLIHYIAFTLVVSICLICARMCAGHDCAVSSCGFVSRFLSPRARVALASYGATRPRMSALWR